MVYYKELNSAGQIQTVGTTIDGTVLPSNFIQITKSEYDSWIRIFDAGTEPITLTPLNEKGELILNASV